jgi:hypothetical protein
MRFSAIYQPVSLFSLKDSNATNSGSKSLLLPSPYAIKMALLNQAIIELSTKPFEANKSKELSYISNTEIFFNINGSFCVNNCFIKILKLKEDKRGVKQKEAGIEFEPGFANTVSFREYIYLSQSLEIIFQTESSDAKIFLKRFLHRINYFGKRGCFFQFVEYLDSPNEPNVKEFDANNISVGVLQEFDDMSKKVTFENVNNYDNASAKREKRILVIPVQNLKSSKAYTHFKCI